ncbi:MAG: IS1595 family transposase [Acidobacteriota bacterium]|nr:IS1595 family transposase [Acidobacteriota bacterium]
MNLFSLAKAFPTEDDALAYWIKARWPGGVRCLACDNAKVYQIETKGKTGKPCKIFECAECGLHFSATTGTLFHDSHLPLQKWFAAIALMVEAKKGISASQLVRHLGVTYKTAWYLSHRIRHAMQENKDMKLGGETTAVEIDETFVGGRKRRTGVQAGRDAKTIVIGMAERGGRIHLQTIPNRKASSIAPLLAANVSPETREIVTDSMSTYQFTIPKEKHTQTIHKEELRNKDWTSTQTVENAFSLFKRGIVGNYHQLSRGHLDRYLGEFCWRYNRRKMQPWLFDMALTNLANKRPLPYKDLTFQPCTLLANRKR